MSLWLSLCLHVSVCLASVLLESVKQTHPLRSSLLLQIENTFVLCFHQETSESRARDSVTEAGETLQCEREILLFILLVSHVPSVFVTDVTSLFCRSVMPWSTRVALLMLLIGQISAGKTVDWMKVTVSSCLDSS